MYFTIKVWLITHSVDVGTEDVTTSVLFLNTSGLCPLTAHVAGGHSACTPGKRLMGMRVALGKSLSKEEYRSVKGGFTPGALETAL